MKKLVQTISFVSIAILLTACSVRTGLLVEVSDGTKPLMGEAVASLVGGTFQASNLDGLICDGTYNQFSQSKMLKTSVVCNDGRYGEVVILRTGPNLMNGSGQGRLNDGTVFRVLLGDMVHYHNAQGIWEKVK